MKFTRNYFETHKVHKPYLVQYVNKYDGRKGQGYRYDTLDQAEKAKSNMEEAWGAQLWDVVITKD